MSSLSRLVPLVALLLSTCVLGDSDKADFHAWSSTVDAVRSAMQASIRTSWEQGTAAGAILEWDDSEYSVFSPNPFVSNGQFPLDSLQFAYSAAVRQTPDGRLSQNINDALDAAALDGASSGSVVLMGTFTDPDRASFWENAADGELNYVLNVAPRTKTGAISARADSAQYWSDGVYMGFPFIAYYGAVKNNGTLLQIAYDQCRLYRDALLVDGPHLVNFGLISTTMIPLRGLMKAFGLLVLQSISAFCACRPNYHAGNGWAALGMLRVAVTIQKSSFCSSMTSQVADLLSWVKEILDGEFAALGSDNLIPDYLTDGPNFGDASSSAALASVAYRVTKLYPDQFGSNYTNSAANVRDAVLGGITNLGVVSPVVNPLVWNETGLLSTEAQGFTLMMMSAWRDWIGA
ncbi:hypothetical protein EDC04DRAFT_2889417 [Pisolithus marmoratus]|nr:hypothetical protein EDC04DRAFT_2889417 [Pisolithus marmoratus]